MFSVSYKLYFFKYYLEVFPTEFSEDHVHFLYSVHKVKESISQRLISSLPDTLPLSNKGQTVTA
jgi:hypothetical protein